MEKLKPLVIGDLVVKKPVIQGGMGVGISLHRLAGAVAKAGGMGIISAAQIGFQEPDFTTNFVEANTRAIHREMELAREIAPEGAIGFNIMVAAKHYALWVKEAVKAGADIIISGAGLPASLPQYVEEAYAELAAAGKRLPVRRIKLAPIVSTAKSAMVICKLWDRKGHTAPDLVVVEGPLAGGHLGFSREQLSKYGADTADTAATYEREAYEQEVKSIMEVVKEYGEKYGKHIPVVTAGGIYTHEDVLRQFELGAEGVQVGTRFVTTEECDASEAYKESYLKAEKEDIVITQSPVGMPGRAIMNSFLTQIKAGNRPPITSCFQCLEHCDIRTIPYCITRALVNAAKGDIENALLFCGSNAYRAEKMETVNQVMAELVGE
jgi:nitronate monooxygenase